MHLDTYTYMHQAGYASNISVKVCDGYNCIMKSSVIAWYPYIILTLVVIIIDFQQVFSELMSMCLCCEFYLQIRNRNS